MQPYPYTTKDTYVKSRTVQQAVDAASTLLLVKYNISSICLDKCYNRDFDQKITPVECDSLIEELVVDTLYWN